LLPVLPMDLMVRPATLVALDATFALRVADPQLRHRLTEVFAALLGQPPGRHTITVEASGDGGPWLQVMVDDRPVVEASSFAGLVDAVVSPLNQAAILESGRHLLLHAAAAELDGLAVVLPAPSGSGKSTLVTRLVDAGFGYVSDEIVAIDPVSLRLVPYPKPLVLDAGGSRSVVSPPLSTSAVRVAAIVTPSYRPGSQGSLVPVTRSEAVLMLAENSFNFHDHGAAGLRTLARLARQCEVFRLDVDDATLATGQIRSILEDAVGHGG